MPWPDIDKDISGNAMRIGDRFAVNVIDTAVASGKLLGWELRCGVRGSRASFPWEGHASRVPHVDQHVASSDYSWL